MRRQAPPYGLGRIIHFILRHVLKYRKQVITNNFTRVFPEKSIAEINILRNKFYKQLSITFAEMMYAYAYPQKIFDRVVYKNFDEISFYLKEGKCVILAGGHFYNWEWIGMCLSKACSFPIYGIYKPLSNKYFDEYLKKTRSILGVQLISMRQAKKTIIDNIDKKEAGVYALASDQSPTYIKKSIWVKFFGVKTPFYPGAEFFSSEFDLPVFHLSVSCPKKGHYVAQARRIKSNGRSITESYATALEEDILSDPICWLWSHNRWKYIED